MNYLITESQFSQTIIKFCEMSFREIQESCDGPIEDIPNYLNLESCFVCGLVEKLEFSNVSKTDSKSFRSYPPKKSSLFLIDCKIYYWSLNYHGEEFFESMIYDIRQNIKRRFRLDVSINIIDTVNKYSDRQW